MSRNSSAVISGAGPSGLAAAIKLHHLGWKKIYLVERETSLSIVNRGKAFNYQLDGRGQKMLADIGINEDKVREFGVANLVSKFTVYGH
jgi:2-polyprenyl-6-methoxyphenol hydroxylase-like FAD-dependent oxidoreductase